MYKDCVSSFDILILEQGMIPISGPVCEKVMDASQKIWLETLKESSLGMACVLFHP